MSGDFGYTILVVYNVCSECKKKKRKKKTQALVGYWLSCLRAVEGFTIR